MSENMTQKSFAQGSAFPPTKPGVLRLYNMRFCPYAQRTRLVLEHKKIPYEIVNVNLKSKPDWFLALNPLGQVPVLQIDDKVVVESTATSDWLDDVYPENRLQPADPYRRAWDRVLLEYVGKLQGASHRVARAEASQLQEELDGLVKHLTFYEDKLKLRGEEPYFGGSKPAMIDFLLWPFFERIPSLGIMRDNAAAGINEQKFPKLTSWVKVMWQLPEVKATAFEPAQHAKWYMGHIAGSVDYDMFLEE